MQLSLKGFSQLVQDMGAALQSSATSLIDVSVGSVIRAIFEANASVVLWLQWMVLQVLQTTRAATSNGTDLDSWMADFSLTRLPAVAATGIVSFSRFATNLAATIPVGTVIKTTDGSLSFSVTADQSLSIWSTTSSGYVLPAGLASANVPVVCTTAGTVGNVLPGTITVIAASVPGIDQVINNNALSDGMNAETDQAFRTRFQNYLASLSRATCGAVKSAIAGVQQGLHVRIDENMGPNGSAQIGSFLVTVDDGTGYPPTLLLASVADAVDPVRPVGTSFTVQAPQVVSVAVSLTVTLYGTSASASASSLISARVASYLNGLPIGKTASITRVAQSAYSAGIPVDNVSVVQLNGGSSDIVPPPRSVIKAGQIQVTINDG